MLGIPMSFKSRSGERVRHPQQGDSDLLATSTHVSREMGKRNLAFFLVRQHLAQDIPYEQIIRHITHEKTETVR
jgi:hypothetical protein